MYNDNFDLFNLWALKRIPRHILTKIKKQYKNITYKKFRLDLKKYAGDAFISINIGIFIPIDRWLTYEHILKHRDAGDFVNLLNAFDIIWTEKNILKSLKPMHPIKYRCFIYEFESRGYLSRNAEYHIKSGRMLGTIYNINIKHGYTINYTYWDRYHITHEIYQDYFKEDKVVRIT